MRLVGIIIAAGIGLAALKVGILFAALLTPAILAYWAMTNPALFWSQLIAFTLLVWANAYPAVGLLAFASITVAGILLRPKDRIDT